MAQVRVGGSIARAYSFFFSRFLSIVGFSWLPCIFLTALSSWWLAQLSASATFAGDAGPAPRVIAEALGFVVIALLLASAIAVPLSRLALDDDVEGAAARFAIGRRELKLSLAFFKFLAVVGAALMILVVGYAALAEAGFVPAIAGVVPGPMHFSTESQVLWYGIPARDLAPAGGAALSIVMVLVLAARLGFFLVPVAATENAASLTRAAALSAGNTWRLVVVCAFLMVPVLVALAAAEFFVLGAPVRANLLHALSVGMPDHVLGIVASHAPAIAAVASIAAVSFLSLVAGASAEAYRDRRDDVPVQDRAPVERREPRDPSMVGIARAPAFAGVHPLATLLPSEMPATTAQELRPPVDASVLIVTSESQTQAGAGTPPSSNPEQQFSATEISAEQSVAPPRSEPNPDEQAAQAAYAADPNA